VATLERVFEGRERTELTRASREASRDTRLSPVSPLKKQTADALALCIFNISNELLMHPLIHTHASKYDSQVLHMADQVVQ
jgi:hypothetical protein